jgi:hypothetical protein
MMHVIGIFCGLIQRLLIEVKSHAAARLLFRNVILVAKENMRKIGHGINNWMSKNWESLQKEE